MPNVLFTGDTHFGHEAIIRHQYRPFATVDEMDEALIANWNAAVRPGDHIYHLGDFSLASRARTAAIFERLAGVKHLILGNHDPDTIWKLGWASVHELRRIKVADPRPVPVDPEADGVSLVRLALCHYPLITWRGADGGALHLHGHCHGNLPDDGQPRLDVGVDRHEFRPISLEEVLALIGDRTYTPVDHHGPKLSTVSA